jgi:hypothetical protein
MNQAIQERHSHLLIAEDLGPLRKSQVGGNSDAGAFIAVATLTNILQISIIHSANSFR